MKFSQAGKEFRKNKAYYLTTFGFILISIIAILVSRFGISFDFRSHAQDTTNRGMVMTGLVKEKNGPCKNLYRITGLKNNRVACTHGPDPAPAGIDVRNAFQIPVPAQKSSVPQTTVQAADSQSVYCDGDGQSGLRVKVLYVRPITQASRFNDLLGYLRTWSHNIDTMVANSSGGTRHIRFEHDANCLPVIDEVILTLDGVSDFGKTQNELLGQGYNRSDRKYLLFVDYPLYCGIANGIDDDSHSPSNPNNGGPMYARLDSPCWSTTDGAAHELFHTFGAVQASAPHAYSGGHASDTYDIMDWLIYGSANPDPPPSTVACSDPAYKQLYDCNHDDYFNASIACPSAAYLCNYYNTADNPFLIGAKPIISPTPTPATQCEKDGYTCIVNETTGNDCPAGQSEVSIACQTSQWVCCKPIPTPTKTPTPTPSNCTLRGGYCIVNETTGNDCSPKCERTGSTYSCGGTSLVCCTSCPTPTPTKKPTPTPTRRPTPTPTPRPPV